MAKASVFSKLVGIGVSAPYASQIANGRRAPSLKLALRIYSDLGLRFGPIARATKKQIAALQSVSRQGAGS